MTVSSGPRLSPQELSVDDDALTVGLNGAVNSGMTPEVFPVTYSTLACDALMVRVLPYYGIESVTNCQLWNRGLSDVYIVETAAEAYILRISHAHWRTKSEIMFELELLLHLQQRQIPVAPPLTTADGRLCIDIQAPEGSRYATLFTYAPGQVAIGDLSRTQGYRLGETVAQLHQAATDFRSQAQRQTLTLDYLLDDSLTAIAPFLRTRLDDLTYLNTVIDSIKAQLQDFPQEPPYWGICWGDAHSGNAHFTSDNQITLFDFDQCGYGWRAFELAKFWQVAIRTGMGQCIRDAFLKGYQSIQAVTELELAALQTFTQAAHIWMWAICLNTAKLHHYSMLDPSFFTHRLEQLKMLRSPEWQLF